jgi:hypothetical protein
LLLAELVQKFKFLQNSSMAKWFHETELHGIYLYNFKCEIDCEKSTLGNMTLIHLACESSI